MNGKSCLIPLLSQILNGGSFAAIYTIEINTEATYAKAKTLFSDTPTGEFNYSQIAYNEDTSQCQEFSKSDLDQGQRREYRLSCLRFDFYVLLRKDDESSRFISQDTSKHFWWFICIDGSVRSLEACDEGFFDLNIADNREEVEGELDLNGLPWDKIAEDLEDFTGLQIDDTVVKYGWIGEECSLQ